MSVAELARKYYPHLWDRARLEALVAAGKLTEKELEKLTGPLEDADQSGFAADAKN